MEKQKPTRTLASGDGIIFLSLPRTGTFSLAAALQMLGLGPILHGLQVPRTEYVEWRRAAWDNLPYLRQSTVSRPPWIKISPELSPWTREQFNQLVGNRYRGIADFGCFFAEQLVAAYPEARFILVERDLDAWERSIDYFYRDIHEGFMGFVFNVLGPWQNDHTFGTIRDFAFAFARGSNAAEARGNLRRRYVEYHAMVRRIVPADQLLVYDLGEGWGPLCEFLGVEEPKDKPFPRLNDQKSFHAIAAYIKWIMIRRTLLNVLAAASVFGTVWFVWHVWQGRAGLGSLMKPLMKTASGGRVEL